MTAAPELLRVESDSVAEVEDVWNDFAPSAKLLRADEQQCRLQWVSLSVPGLSLIEYELHADVRASVAPEGQLFACRLTSPSAEMWSERTSLPTGRPWLTDGRPVDAVWEGSARVQAMAFDLGYAERLARQITGDDRLVLRTRSPEAIGQAASRRWDATFRHLMTALQIETDESGALEFESSQLWSAGLQRYALWATLACFATTFGDSAERSAQTLAAPRAVRQAVAYIEEHAHEAITIDDVARAAHMSTRGLHAAFRRALGTTPSAELKRARLSGARADLLDAEPGDSVAAIGGRWGFTNVTRFTRAFHEVYGEDARVLLRRQQHQFW
ncbi:helix-turn-helix transcriptional regulator [Leucobacter sp. GX0328]